jgi:hypothetical protein
VHRYFDVTFRRQHPKPGIEENKPISLRNGRFAEFDLIQAERIKEA